MEASHGGGFDDFGECHEFGEISSNCQINVNKLNTWKPAMLAVVKFAIFVIACISGHISTRGTNRQFCFNGVIIYNKTRQLFSYFC